NGKGLAVNTDVPEIGIVPGELGDKKEKVIKELAKKLDLTEDDIKKKLDQGWVKDDSFVPLKKVKPDQEKLVSEATS
ncbi:penicillin-binding transpeptidase domain-containing protein, partial [Enterococcus faecalis]